MSASTSRGYDYSKEDNGYDSTNEDDIEARDAKRARLDLAEKPKHDRREKAKAHSGVFSAEAAADEGRRQRVKLLQLNAYDRHKQLVNTYQGLTRVFWALALLSWLHSCNTEGQQERQAGY